jgi:hypothetical protein
MIDLGGGFLGVGVHGALAQGHHLLGVVESLVELEDVCEGGGQNVTEKLIDLRNQLLYDK